jgi:NAD(P)-binding Rossmann-like domain
VTKINIIGAGMAGLLAANMLRRHDITVFEKQARLPNNHAATLRFRTSEIGNVLGIPFKKVNMLKTYVPYRNVVADSLSYSKKCTGKYLSDRSIVAGTVTAERYIAPSYLINMMAENIDINYEIDHSFYDKTPIISTIPMQELMRILGYKSDIIFDSLPGIVFSATIKNCDAYVSVLFPGPEPYSRATITGDQLIIEFPGSLKENYSLDNVYEHLGIYGAIKSNDNFKKQDYFKIIDIEDADRKKFQRWATVNHNVYSLGRYATWRPKLLLDDLVQDIRKIEGWITGGI